MDVCSVLFSFVCMSAYAYVFLVESKVQGGSAIRFGRAFLLRLRTTCVRSWCKLECWLCGGKTPKKKPTSERLEKKYFQLSVVHACVFSFSCKSVGKCLWQTPVFTPLLFLYCAQPWPALSHKKLAAFFFRHIPSKPTSATGFLQPSMRRRQLNLSSCSLLPAPCSDKTSHPVYHPHNTLACHNTSLSPSSLPFPLHLTAIFALHFYLPLTHTFQNIFFCKHIGLRLCVCFFINSAQGMGLIHMHTNHPIKPAKTQPPHPLAKYTQTPWLYPPPPLTKERTSVGRA